MCLLEYRVTPRPSCYTILEPVCRDGQEVVPDSKLLMVQPKYTYVVSNSEKPQ